jgi:hypothetical protein
VETADDYHLSESIFAVRPLKHGTCEVVLKRDVESPIKHIADFRSPAEARAWIKENAAAWRRSIPPRK